MTLPSLRQPFAILPSRFLWVGMMMYISLEMLAAFALQYMDALSVGEQSILLWMRMLELLAFVILIWHFRLHKVLGLSRLKSSDIRIFFLISAVCVLVVVALYMIQPKWFSYITVPKWLQGASGVFLMVVLAPIVEELIFRGLLYRMLREQWGIVSSVLVSSVFFSLLHDGLLVSPQLAGGIIFAVAYEWSRSLWVSIGLHMGANGAVYLLATHSVGF